jgi:adhesin transport system outer membrane protein
MKFKHTAVAVLIAAMSVSTPVLARSLENELQSLLIEHPLLKSARTVVKVYDKGRDVASSGYYPRLSISGDTGDERIETPGANTNLRRRKLSATVEQNLYAGGRTTAAADIAEIDYTAQNNSLNTTTQDLLLEGITAYMQVARFQTLMAIARRNEDTTQRQLSLENQRVERGGGIAVDVMQARSRLQLVKERRVFYEQGLRDAVANYSQVFGHAPELAGMQELDIFTDLIPKSLEAALEQGRNQSPRIRDAFLQSKKAQKQIGVERSGMFPSIDVVGTRAADTNVNAIAKRDETSVLLRFSWNLFSGFETTNRTDAASLQHQVLLERETAVILKSDETIRIAWNQLINGREREELLDSAAKLSYDVMQNRKRLRDAGKEAAINVLDAEVEYYAVLSNKLNAMNDTRIGSYRLLAAMGALTPDALGLKDGKFALPVKPLSLEVGKLEAETVAPVGQYTTR